MSAEQEPQGAAEEPRRADDARIAARLTVALTAPDPSSRLQAALTAGTRPDPALVEGLIARCRVEPDLNVREMLTWALLRHDPADTVDRLVAELASPIPQARSQALHTLSKIGDRRAYPAITRELLRDADPHVARTAWRTASGLVDEDGAPRLAVELASQLGRGDADLQAALSRSLVVVGDAALPVLARSRTAVDARVRVHAIATIRMIRDPEARFDDAVAEARRTAFGGHLDRSPGDAPPGAPSPAPPSPA